jgi:hypothetical protein
MHSVVHCPQWCAAFAATNRTVSGCLAAAAAAAAGCNTLFCRSGLRDTYTNGFAEEPVYRAYRAFLQVGVAGF